MRRMFRRRIPVIMVTGTNGKTTTVRMASYILKEFGHTVGYTSTNGVVVAGRTVLHGDQAGYKGAHRVFKERQVTAAVLEVARGDLLLPGLYMDRCNAAALLNVDREHLGLGGINTVEEMAAYKQQVVNAGRTVVLNADDKLCVKMTNDYSTARTILFAMAQDNPFLIRHIDHGGTAFYVARNQDNEEGIIYANNNCRQLLQPIAAMPSTAGGIIRHNIENAMAAAALTLAVGVPIDIIRKALATFNNSIECSSGRFNEIEGYPFRIIVDRADNPPAAKSLMKTVRVMSADRKLCMFTVTGNRPESVFQEMTEEIAEHFDIFVSYEIAKYRRGRGDGEIADKLKQALMNKGIEEHNIRTAMNPEDAFHHLATLTRPADLVFLLSLDDVNKWLPTIHKEFRSNLQL